MKENDILAGLGGLDAELVVKFAPDAEKKSIKKKTPAWIKCAAVAACVCVLAASVTVGMFMKNGFGEGGKHTANIDFGNIFRDYKNNFAVAESALVYPWDCLEINEQYSDFRLDGKTFINTGGELEKSDIGASLGKGTGRGGDIYENKEYSEKFEAYEIKGVSPELMIALKMDGKYYTYKLNEFASKDTFGEFLAMCDIESFVELSYFTEYKDKKTDAHYTLDGVNDDYIWSVLQGCTSASSVDNDIIKLNRENYLSFSITSEKLGKYKVAMYITAEGYLWTNMYDYAYAYYIGEDAAHSITEYAKANSKETEFRPYYSTVTGKVTEIHEDYILIDDTELCKNKEDGMVFKLPLDNKKIAFAVERTVKVGSTVAVSFKGNIDTENGNVIIEPMSISKAIVSGGDVLIPE